MGFGQPQHSPFPVHSHMHMHTHMQQQMPRMLYLFTSHRPEFAPFWADSPAAFGTQPEKRMRVRDVIESVAWLVHFVHLACSQTPN